MKILLLTISLTIALNAQVAAEQSLVSNDELSLSAPSLSDSELDALRGTQTADLGSTLSNSIFTSASTSASTGGSGMVFESSWTVDGTVNATVTVKVRPGRD
jgi:hypothetical protein